MLSHIRPALVMIILMTVLTGILYPMAITGISQAIFHDQANGSLILRDQKIIGSRLIGQNFTSDKYFRSRPSATTAPDPADSTKTVPAPYNAANSGGSNLGPTSQSLIDGIKANAQSLHAAAQFQIASVAKARGFSEGQVATLVERHTKVRIMGIFGEPTVNVLDLNLALDGVKP